jgi:zinc/manganese transport system substrate-binding protein
MQKPTTFGHPKKSGAVWLLLTGTLFGLIAGAGTGSSAPPPRAATVLAVGAENEYANVIGQIGGRYVSTSAIMSNPNTDPHTFEASPTTAQVVSAAQLVVQNGVGYDGFMNKIEAASPSATRKVIDVQTLLGLPTTTANPHLWYSPTTMPAVAHAIASALELLAPAHTSYFEANLRRFDASLGPWRRAIAKLRASFPGAAVATTEPVADYTLQAAGIDNLTPWTLQADIMNGVDPSPQGISLEESLLNQHKVRAFVYNQQVTDTITESFLALARSNGIPVVGVYETMPTPGYDYQSWMLAETNALYAAFAHEQSTTQLR